MASAGRLSRATTATAAVEELFDLQVEQIDLHAARGDRWATDSVRDLLVGALRQVVELGELLGALRDRRLSPEDRRRLKRLCANAANYFAFLAKRADLDRPSGAAG